MSHQRNLETNYINNYLNTFVDHHYTQAQLEEFITRSRRVRFSVDGERSWGRQLVYNPTATRRLFKTNVSTIQSKLRYAPNYVLADVYGDLKTEELVRADEDGRTQRFSVESKGPGLVVPEFRIRYNPLNTHIATGRQTRTAVVSEFDKNMDNEEDVKLYFYKLVREVIKHERAVRGWSETDIAAHGSAVVLRYFFSPPPLDTMPDNTELYEVFGLNDPMYDQDEVRANISRAFPPPPPVEMFATFPIRSFSNFNEFVINFDYFRSWLCRTY